MRCTDGIKAVFLELFDAPDPQCVGNGGTHTGRVLMDIGAMKADHLSINQDAAVGIDLDLGKRKRRFGRGLAHRQPNMPVDAGPFIEPAFFECRIDTDRDDVVAAIVQVFGNIVSSGRIAALLAAQPEAVDPDV